MPGSRGNGTEMTRGLGCALCLECCVRLTTPPRYDDVLQQVLLLSWMVMRCSIYLLWAAGDTRATSSRGQGGAAHAVAVGTPDIGAQEVLAGHSCGDVLMGLCQNDAAESIERLYDAHCPSFSSHCDQIVFLLTWGVVISLLKPAVFFPFVLILAFLDN